MDSFVSPETVAVELENVSLYSLVGNLMRMTCQEGGKGGVASTGNLFTPASLLLTVARDHAIIRVKLYSLGIALA